MRTNPLSPPWTRTEDCKHFVLDFVKDTSDTESRSQFSECSSTDEYEVEVAYEVESNADSSDISSPESVSYLSRNKLVARAG